MDAQDELGSDHTHHIIKGKRTKRQRSSSPFVAAAATVTSTSSSAGGGGGGGGGGGVSDDYSSAASSPATTTISSSAPAAAVSDCTEEEEDMAICLIMLARGAGPTPPPEKLEKPEKIHKSSEKTHHENSGLYVYECKTCNRTFPSFQALGGHRASHKKPRTDEKTKSPLATPKPSPSEEGQNCQTTKISGALTLPSPSSNNSNNNNNKPSKVHECSICGSEFTSGQALGGHMRRHRTTATSSAAEGGNNPVGASPGNTEGTDNVDRRIEQRKYLPLDLNLPAPEDDLRESKFQGLVFSATPALVDCHY